MGDLGAWWVAGFMGLVAFALGAAWWHHERQQKKRRANRRRAKAVNPYPPMASPPTSRPATPTSNYRGRRPLILLVDDSETILKATSGLLEDRQYRVITAENGKKAWSMLQDSHQRPDAVITDIDMPMMNGFHLLRLIRSDLVLSDLPVILMTGKAYYHVQAGREQGSSGLLSKPFKSDDLYEQLRFVLQE